MQANFGYFTNMNGVILRKLNICCNVLCLYCINPDEYSQIFIAIMGNIFPKQGNVPLRYQEDPEKKILRAQVEKLNQQIQTRNTDLRKLEQTARNDNLNKKEIESRLADMQKMIDIQTKEYQAKIITMTQKMEMGNNDRLELQQKLLALTRKTQYDDTFPLPKFLVDHKDVVF